MESVLLREVIRRKNTFWAEGDVFRLVQDEQMLVRPPSEESQQAVGKWSARDIKPWESILNGCSLCFSGSFFLLYLCYLECLSHVQISGPA